MKPHTIEDLLRALADEMAAHDGIAAGPAHIMGAANQLQSALIEARDRLLSPAPSPAAPDPVEAAAEVPAAAEPEPEPVVVAEPATVPPPAPENAPAGKRKQKAASA